MKTIINTDIKMPKKMMESLSLFEAYCIGMNKNTTTIDEVKDFITKHYNIDLANKFNDKYLYQ